MKKELIFLSALLLFLPIVIAGNTEDNYFFEKGTGNSIANVNMLIYKCTDNNEQCVTVEQPAWHNSNSGSNNYILNVGYPGTANPTDYAEYFYASGYLPLAFVVPNDWGTGQHYTYYDYFEKGENCYAPVDSFSVINTAYANEPLQINVSAKLDATTYSAFGDAGMPPYFVPNAYKEEYYSARTLVTLNIYNPSGNLVYTESKQLNIYMDQSQKAEFIWTPTIDGNNYKAEIKTEINDNQCNLATASAGYTSKTFNILPARPRNECYTLLNALSTSEQFPIVNDTLSIYYSKISNYADDSSLLTPISTDVTYTIKNSGGTAVYSNSLNLAANPDTINPTTKTFSWTPTAAGWYNITVDGIGNSALCAGLPNYAEQISEGIYVKPIPTHNIIFTVRDLATSNAIQNAYIVVNGADGYTASDGMLTLTGFQSGTYIYTVTHPSYHVSSGSITVGNTDLYVDIQLTHLNWAPVISPIPDINMDEDTAYSLLDLDDYGSDTDHPDSQLTWAATGNSNIGVSINSATHLVTFTPATNWNGQEAITFTVTDPEGASASDTIIVIVDSVNDVPVISNLPDQNLNEDTPLFDVFNLNNYASDTEMPDSALIYSIAATTDANCGASIDANDNIDIQPTLNWYGVCTVTIQVSDGALTATDSFVVTVNSVNDAPVVAGLPDVTFQTGNSDNSIDLDYYAYDAEDADNLLAWSYTGNTNVNIAIGSNNVVTFTAVPGFIGSETVTFTATDTNSASDSDSMAVSVTPIINNPPTITNIPDQSLNEDSGLNNNIIDLWAYASDAETAPSGLVYTITAETNTVVVDCTVDTNRYIDCTTLANQNGYSDVTVQVSDGSLAATDTFRVNVANVNDAPAWTTSIADASQNEDFGAITHVTDLSTYVTDADGDAITFSVSAENTAQVDCQITGNQLTLNSVANWNGAASCTIRANDNNGGTADDTFSINVNPVSDNPTVTITAPTEGETISGTYTVTWAASDPDQSSSTLDIMIQYRYNGTSWITLEDAMDNNDGSFTWDTTTLSDANDYRLMVTVTDNDLNIVTDTVDQFTVDNPQAPNANITAPSVGEIINGVYPVTWTATDLEQATNTLDILLQYRCCGNTAWTDLFSSANNPGIFSWDTTTVPNANDYELRVIATDDTSLTGTGYVSQFTIGPNSPTVNITAPADGETISGTYTITWAASDPDQAVNTLDVLIEYRYNGTSWTTLFNSTNNPGSYLWDTTVLSDANDYRLRVTVTDDNSQSGIDTIDQFTVDNPSAPNVNITQPLQGAIWSGVRDIVWAASDPNQPSSTLDTLIQYRCCGNTAWTNLFNSSNNPGLYSWNTSTVQNSNDYELRVIATDDTSLTGTGYVIQFSISNIIILPPPVAQPKPQNKVHIDKINIGSDSVKAGEDLVIAIGFENAGDLDLDDVSAVAVIQELGIKKKIGPFDLDRNDDTARTIVLEIPEYAEPGQYDVRITINNDKIRRVRHRPVIIK